MQKLKELLSKKPKIEIANYLNLIFILIIVLYLGLFLRPTIKRFFQVLPEASRLKAEITKIEKEWQDLDSFNKRISRSYEKLDYYEKSLPGKKDIAALLKFLSNTAKEMNVRITEIKPIEDADKIVRTPVYYEVPILMLAECGYHQLGRFLNKLENADRFMRISKIKIITDLQHTHKHFVKLTVSTFVMKK